MHSCNLKLLANILEVFSYMSISLLPDADDLTHTSTVKSLHHISQVISLLGK